MSVEYSSQCIVTGFEECISSIWSSYFFTNIPSSILHFFYYTFQIVFYANNIGRYYRKKEKEKKKEMITNLHTDNLKSDRAYQNVGLNM